MPGGTLAPPGSGSGRYLRRITRVGRMARRWGIDLDAARPQGFGNFARDLDVEQSVAQISGRYARVVRELKDDLERRPADTLVEIFFGALFFALATLDLQAAEGPVVREPAEAIPELPLSVPLTMAVGGRWQGAAPQEDHNSRKAVSADRLGSEASA